MSSSLRIVIPMAGAGSRFRVEGYQLPKPFVDVSGKMMIERVLDSLQYSGSEVHLVIQKQFLSDNARELDVLQSRFKVGIVTVRELTQGASCTALAAFDVINNDDPVVFADSDNLFHGETFSNFVRDAESRNLDASVATFPSENPAFSYIEVDEHGRGIRTREKEVISRHAIAGLYYFARGVDFVRCAIETMIYGDKTRNEYYLSNTLNYLINKGGGVGQFTIGEKDWDCVGTPAQLNAYIAKRRVTPA